MTFASRMWIAGAVALGLALVGAAVLRHLAGSSLSLVEAEIVQVEGEKTVPAATLLQSTAAGHVCSTGPYFAPDFAPDERDRQLLKGLNVFPVPEGEGFIILVPSSEEGPAIARLQRNSGHVRWRADDNPVRCLPLDRVAFRIRKEQDHWTISLVDPERR